jgi:uncharacterized secreted protein with C-terminal beta-propeller domain
MRKEIVVIGLFFIFVSATLTGCIVIKNYDPDSEEKEEEIFEIPFDEETSLKTFDDFEELESFIDENQQLQGSYYTYKNLDSSGHYRRDYWQYGGYPSPPSMDADSDGGGESSDFSTTNVQEKGVDEGDVVKNDGNYAYIVSKDQRKVFVLDVYPPGSMEIISTIDIEDGNIKELYLSGNKLTILGTKGGSSYYYYRDPYYQSDDDPPAAFVKVFNIDDRREPVLFREDEIEGNFISSRMIDGYFYMIMSRYCSNVENESTLPAPANEIYYADEYDTSYSFIGVSSINVHSRDEVPYGRMMLFGYSSEIYVSTNNVYLTQSKRMSWFEQMEREIDDVVVPILPNREKWLLEGVDNADLTRQEKMSEKDRIIGEYLDNISESQENDFYEKWREGKVNFTKKIAPELEMTAIHRISIQRGYINFKASGEVPGYILNRFSMGEYDSHFRIATTTGHVSRTGVGTAKNHLFVLNSWEKGPIW